MVSWLFFSPPFIGHYQLKHTSKSSNQGQRDHLIESSYRVHPLVVVIMSAKFDEEAHNGLVSIMFIRSKCDGHMHALTDRTTAA